MAQRLAPVDAQTLWLSATMPNDQFVVYAFARPPGNLAAAVEDVRRRAAACPELGLRIHDPGGARYPLWLPGVEPDIRIAEPAETDWDGCQHAILRLTGQQLDCRRRTWALHLFPVVHELPGRLGPGAVAVVQLAHALGDGIRSAALAGRLFGRAGNIPGPVGPAGSAWSLPGRTRCAARTQRLLARDVRSGLIPPTARGVPPLRTNTRTAGPRGIRTILRARAALGGVPVTVGVLTAVGTALAAQLRELREAAEQLGAEVPMAKTTVRTANNHFGNVGVGLHPHLRPPARAAAIDAELTLRRQRRAHPATAAADRAFAATPAALLRWGVARFDPGGPAPQVTGNTVVSSVRRGPADLDFGGADVVFTTGFPALSAKVGLAHGVHGIGDTVMLSVYAAAEAIGDLDAYTERLGAAWPGTG